MTRYRLIHIPTGEFIDYNEEEMRIYFYYDPEYKVPISDMLVNLPTCSRVSCSANLQCDTCYWRCKERKANPEQYLLEEL